ncbi:hypothetical protein APHAL10511_001473 [Amanita phalloides]|nr:hypothetical protein APHAL10511_001473 [Amanita phalloides]
MKWGKIQIFNFNLEGTLSGWHLSDIRFQLLASRFTSSRVVFAAEGINRMSALRLLYRAPFSAWILSPFSSIGHTSSTRGNKRLIQDTSTPIPALIRIDYRVFSPPAYRRLYLPGFDHEVHRSPTTQIVEARMVSRFDEDDHAEDIEESEESDHRDWTGLLRTPSSDVVERGLRGRRGGKTLLRFIPMFEALGRHALGKGTVFWAIPHVALRPG